MDIPLGSRITRAVKAAKHLIKWDKDEIRKMHKNGMSYKEIMEITGITSKGTLSYIINKRY